MQTNVAEKQTVVQNDTEENLQLYISEQEKNHMRVVESLEEYSKKNDMKKEIADEVKMLKEDVGFLMDENETMKYTQLSNGEFVVARKKTKTKQKLNKEALSEYLDIPMEDMKTQLDMVMLATQGKLTAETLKMFTTEVEDVTVSIRTTKKNPAAKEKKKR